MDPLIRSSKKSCRACLQQPVQQMYSLAFHNARIEDNNRTKIEEIDLADIYCQCTQLIYEQTDSQWEWICIDCYEKLVEFFKFRAMCIDSYKKLKEYGSIVEEKPAHIQVAFKVEVVDVTDILEPIEDKFASDNEHFGDEANDESKTIENGHSEIDTEMDNTEIYIKECESLNVSIGDDDDDDVETPQEEGEDEEDEDDDEDVEEPPQMTGIIITQNVRTEKSPKKRRPIKKPRKTDAAKSNSNDMIACEKCPSKFFKKHRYDAHLRTHLGLKQWLCEHCEKSFKKYTTLKIHLSTKHYDEAEGRPTFICDVDACGRMFSTKDTLRSHILKFHFGRMPDPLPKKICEQCGKSFANNNALLKHSYTHTKVTPHKCPICAKMFATNYKLKEHQLRHDGIKNFICPTCGLRKTTGHELRVHMKYHSTDMKFPCDLCSLVFTRMANMKRHKRIVHCGIKAFPCPHCDRSFGKAETLKHHIMTHTGEKPQACTVCDKRFIQPIALKTHMKVHNKIKK